MSAREATPEERERGMAFALLPTREDEMASGWEFLVLRRPGRALVKHVFIQDETEHLPKVLDRLLTEFRGSVVGVNVQSNAQGKRSVARTALDLLGVYGPAYFARKAGRLALDKLRAKDTVRAVAARHGVPVHEARDVNAEEFRALLRSLGVELIVSISGTQLYRRELREQTPFGIVNCHGALLPKYRGLMPSFWTLANGETEGGVSVHYVDRKLDNGPIVVQERYAIGPRDTLEDVVARSKRIAGEAIVRAVKLIEAGEPPLMPNVEADGSRYAMPSRADVRRMREHGHELS